jgi:transcription-repair coupling factor (superfamily II helicase)
MGTHYNGVYGPAKALKIAELLLHHKQLVCVVPSLRNCEALAADVEFLCGVACTHLFPGWDTLAFEQVSPNLEITALRFRTLSHILSSEKENMWCLLIPADALMQRTIPKEHLQNLKRTFNVGDSVARDDLLKYFDICGFEHSSRVSALGNIAVRGEVIDFFPSTSPLPIRLEFFDDEIEGIKIFDPSSQRSSESQKSITVLPLREYINLPLLHNKKSEVEAGIIKLMERALELHVLTHYVKDLVQQLTDGVVFPGIEALQSLFIAPLVPLQEILPSTATWIIDDYGAVKTTLDYFTTQVNERAERFTEERSFFVPKNSLYLKTEDILKILDNAEVFFNTFDLSKKEPLIPNKALPNTGLNAIVKSQAGTAGFKPVADYISARIREGHRVALVLGSESRINQIDGILLSFDLTGERFWGTYPEWALLSKRSRISYFLGTLSQGFQLKEEGITLIGEEEIFFVRSQRTSQSAPAKTRKINSSLSQITVGDYLVHIDYGIGRYHGLTHRTLDGTEGDFLEIEYADSSLLLPVQMIGKIQRFSSPSDDEPKLDKLSSTRWLKTKAKIKETVTALAGDLIKLYAKRSIARGWRFEPWGAEDERFAETFPYNETPDQLRAIEETLKDMASESPMDRLICGDVGFGKTEVALRAAFKCIQHARQVAILTPTTLLCEQHVKSFRERFRGYPVEVGVISRFYSAKQNSETLTRVKTGTVDIIVGTHRLLSGDIGFKDLGLLMIDEEHRFGVKQKEKLKSLKSQVDVLSLTATPIPRTLHMSLIGVKDVSIIATPPAKRHPIKTYVARPDDTTVRDAILRELHRDGQVFYLHNRVTTIELVAAQLSELVPESRIRFAHGRMNESTLELIMRDFIEHRFDVLVSTTIIESGIDIPNANTIIVSDAFRYGLAQLYQLRGRVGRGTRQAYAYLLTPTGGTLTTQVRERLGIFASMEDLGLGFELAMRDLEIRGSGNLLGKEQSGHVASVGFDLYTRILKEAVDHLKGDSLADISNIDPEVNLNVVAFIPDFYIPDISERLILYQRLADLSDDRECTELEDEIKDRFGSLPPEVRELLQVMTIRALLRRKGVLKLERNRFNGINITLSPEAPFDIKKIMFLSKKGIKFSKNLTLATQDWWKPEQQLDLENLYEQLEQLLESLRA